MALPEMPHQETRSRCCPHCGNPIDDAEFATERAELIEALRDLFGLIESGWLVRNIEDDAKPDFAVRQLEPTRKLAKASTMLAKYAK